MPDWSRIDNSALLCRCLNCHSIESGGLSPQDLSSIRLGNKENTTALSADQAPTASGQGQQVDQRKNSKGKPVFAVTALSGGMLPGLASKQRVATTADAGQHPAVAQPGPAVWGNCPRCGDTIWKE